MNKTKKTGIKVLQINLCGCAAATDLAFNTMEEEEVDVLLLQDAYVNTDRLKGCQTQWQVYNSENKDAYTVVSNKNLQPTQTLQTISSIFITIQTADGKNLQIGNQYIRPKANLQESLTEWEEKILKGNRSHSEDLLFCGDLNARSESWGYDYQDGRGARLQEFLVKHELIVLNTPGSPQPLTETQG